MPSSHFITEGNQGRNASWGKSQKQEQEECCLLACSLCFLIQPRATCIGEAPCRVDMVFSYQLLLKKMFPQLGYRSIIWWHFLNWNSFFPENSSFLTKLDTSQNNTALTVNWEHIAQYIEDRNKWMFNNINNAGLI